MEKLTESMIVRLPEGFDRVYLDKLTAAIKSVPLPSGYRLYNFFADNYIMPVPEMQEGNIKGVMFAVEKI